MVQPEAFGFQSCQNVFQDPDLLERPAAVVGNPAAVRAQADLIEAFYPQPDQSDPLGVGVDSE